MKKILLTTILALGVVLISNAQDESQIMVGVNGGILGPGCTNCGILTGGGVTAGYAVMDKMVVTLDVNNYGDKDVTSWGTFKTSTTAIGISGDFYPKGVYKGFFIGPDITYLTLKYKLDGTVWSSQGDITAGLNLGWAISAGDKIEIIPHFGYGTWFSGSKGRATMGLKLAYKI